MLKPLFQRVLVAYNGSRSSLHAVLYSILMAKEFKCSVKVVFVVDNVSIKQLTLSHFLIAEEGELLKNNLEADGRKNLEYVTKIAKSKGIKIETELRFGSIWSEIVAASDKFKADLILLGGTKDNTNTISSHENISKQDSEIIGSSHCSVLVVREPYIEQKFKLG